MNKLIAVTATVIMLLFGSYTLGGVSWVANGSFEYDKAIGNIKNEIPSGWDIVDMPADFGGTVTSAWQTDGDYCLNLYTIWGGEFVEDQEATLSQYVYLEDVNEIIFDLKLHTFPANHSWDPNRSAFIKIDDDVVWDSDFLGIGDREFIAPNSLVIDISKIQKDKEQHLLSLGIRTNVSEAFAQTEYYAKWDFLGFDTHCRGGIGFIEADFNRDCVVDMNDLRLFVKHWLDEVNEPNIFNLYDDKSIDFLDYAIFANYWMGSSYGHEEEFLEFDKNADGIVNFTDYAKLVKQWDSEGMNYEQLAAFVDDWLKTNWMYGK